MASRFSTDTPPIEDTVDPFLTKTADIRLKLDTSFTGYQLYLQQRKQSLTDELDRIEAEYKASRAEYKQKRQALDQIQSSVKLQCETFKSMEATLLSEIERQISSLENEYPRKDIDLILDTAFSEQIQRLGRFEMDKVTKETPPSPPEETTESQSKSVIPELTSKPAMTELPKPPTEPRDYTKIKTPIMCAVKQGDEPGDLKCPQRVAVDPKTGNIFIADQTSHCVKIFSQQGEYKGRVEHNRSIERSGTGAKVELVHPFGVCFYQDSLYVTSLLEQNFNREFQPCVFKFDRVRRSETDFRYSVSTGIRGSDEAQFTRPTVISADQSNGDVYVVSDKGNRIQVLDKNLTYKRLVSIPTGYATDIQFKGDDFYLLSDISDLQYILVCMKDNSRMYLHQSEPSQIIVPPLHDSYFILSLDRTVSIGKLKQDRSGSGIFQVNSIQIPVTPADDDHFEIRGITLDESTQRIIVVLHAKENMLQIF